VSVCHVVAVKEWGMTVTVGQYGIFYTNFQSS
jgi:hypothetical protein